METKSERMKKKIEEDRQNHEAALRQKANHTATLNEKEIIGNPQKEEEKKEAQFTMQALDGYALDWPELVADYKKQYPQYPVQKNTLCFPTPEDAITFFSKQAAMEPPRKFLAAEVDQKGSLTNLYVFSCGDKQLYKGSLAVILDQLKAAQEAKPSEQLLEGISLISRRLNPNPTQDFRSAMQGNKESKDTKENNKPNPLKTNPV